MDFYSIRNLNFTDYIRQKNPVQSRKKIRLIKLENCKNQVQIGSGRECVSTGAAGAHTRRSLGHHLLHPLILRLLVLCAPADFEAQSSLL